MKKNEVTRGIQQFRSGYFSIYPKKYQKDEEIYFRFLTFTSLFDRFNVNELKNKLEDCFILPKSFLNSNNQANNCYSKFKQILSSDTTFYQFIFDIIN